MSTANTETSLPCGATEPPCSTACSPKPVYRSLALEPRVCKYCNWAFHDGWGELLKYDDVYHSAVGAETESTHGFHEDWDDLQAELGI